MRIFFVSGVFQKFYVDFWPLLKAEKVLPPKQFWQKKKYFLSFIWIYKLSASRITENSSHCYPLTLSTFINKNVDVGYIFPNKKFNVFKLFCRQARSSPLAEEGLKVLSNLMSCNYTMLDSYIEYGKTHPWLFSHNWRLWHYCANGKASYCYQPNFLGQFCSIFPVQTIKTVRLRLHLTQKFMQDENNKVHFTYPNISGKSCFH